MNKAQDYVLQPVQAQLLDALRQQERHRGRPVMDGSGISPDRYRGVDRGWRHSSGDIVRRMQTAEAKLLEQGYFQAAESDCRRRTQRDQILDKLGNWAPPESSPHASKLQLRHRAPDRAPTPERRREHVPEEPLGWSGHAEEYDSLYSTELTTTYIDRGTASGNAEALERAIGIGKVRRLCPVTAYLSLRVPPLRAR